MTDIIFFCRYSKHININYQRYDYQYLQLSLPYIIEYNTTTKNFFLINRKYQFIGYNNIYTNDSLLQSTNNNHIWSRIYLFDDTNAPWLNKHHLINYILQLKYTLALFNNCLNQNINITNLLPFL